MRTYTVTTKNGNVYTLQTKERFSGATTTPGATVWPNAPGAFDYVQWHKSYKDLELTANHWKAIGQAHEIFYF
jgi:hypothetical protein